MLTQESLEIPGVLVEHRIIEMTDFCFSCQHGTMTSEGWWLSYMKLGKEQRKRCLACDKRRV